MGPRPFSRRHFKERSAPAIESCTFNGTVAIQPQTRGILSHRPGGLAASMGPRPFSRGDVDAAQVLTVAGHASMGPRQFSSGRLAIASGTKHEHLALMGPQPISRGRRRTGQTQLRNVPASIGPRPTSRGDSITGGDPQSVERLQWDGGHAAAETRRRRGQEQGGAASMGPRPFSRRHGPVDVEQRELRLASIGRRPISHGHVRLTIGNRDVIELQWDRGQSAADTCA